MADGERIHPHGIQLSKLEVEPLITNLFGIWRPGLILTPDTDLMIEPWVLIPDDGKINAFARQINKAAHEAYLGSYRARREQRKP